VQFHPDVAGTQNHPDFLVLKDGNARFYLEAIAVGNSTKEESEIKKNRRSTGSIRFMTH
jgi:hypothetical protein